MKSYSDILAELQARPPCKGWALMGNKHDHKPGKNLQRAPIANNGC